MRPQWPLYWPPPASDSDSCQQHTERENWLLLDWAGLTLSCLVLPVNTLHLQLAYWQGIVILDFLSKISNKEQSFKMQKKLEQNVFLHTESLTMDDQPWMPELRGIFLSLICEEIFKNGTNII